MITDFTRPVHLSRSNGIGSIDLLLLDAHMPILAGQDALTQLSAYPEVDELCKIMVTASRRMLDRDVSSHLGASAYGVKPAASSVIDDFLELALTVMAS